MMMNMIGQLKRNLACLMLALALCTPLAGAADPVSPVSNAMQTLRRAMLNPEVNTLTFRQMETLFDTRTVGRAGAVWQLPAAHRALDFQYAHEGNTYAAGEFADRTYTNALLIIKDGRIVHEYYANNMRDDTRHMGWSMTKSIVSLLIGIAHENGLIKSLDDRIDLYLPELSAGAYAGVSIRHILQMRSGVDYEERYDFENPGIAAKNHEQALVQNIVRFADAARTIGRAHPPGEVFAYKTIDTAVLGWLLERVSGTNVSAYLSQHIWERLGMEHAGYFIMDGPPGTGREFTGAGFNASLRDYGRLGLLMLGKGEANGQRIVSERWINESTAPTTTEEGAPGTVGGYGYQWWTVTGSDAYAAIGLQGQHIYIDPATRMVVVKLSYFPPAERNAGEETFSFLAAVSAWNPEK